MASSGAIIGLTVNIKTIAVDPARLSLSVFNKHLTAIVYMKEGNDVDAVNGIPIYPKGNIGLTFRDDGASVREAWSFISDTADTPIVIFTGP